MPSMPCAAIVFAYAPVTNSWQPGQKDSVQMSTSTRGAEAEVCARAQRRRAAVLDNMVPVIQGNCPTYLCHR